jgi:hypothetical protein
MGVTKAAMKELEDATSACGQAADLNVDALAETVAVPDVGRACAVARAAGSGSTLAQHGTQHAIGGAANDRAGGELQRRDFAAGGKRLNL